MKLSKKKLIIEMASVNKGLCREKHDMTRENWTSTY